MFDELARRAEQQRGVEAGRPLITQANELVDQAQQDFEDHNASVTHYENLNLLEGLVSLDGALNVPGMINDFNDVVADVDEYDGWQVTAEPYSWVPFAKAALTQDRPLEGLRAVRAWHLRWQSRTQLPDEAPSDSLIALYRWQQDGIVRPPRAADLCAVVPGNRPGEQPDL